MTTSGWGNRPHNPAYDSKEYRAARKACLAAAKVCALAYPGCTKVPTQADHRDGLANDPEHRNLQGVCASCHGVKTRAEAEAARLGGRPSWRPSCVDDRWCDDGLGRLELVHPPDGKGGRLVHSSNDSQFGCVRRFTDWSGGKQQEWEDGSTDRPAGRSRSGLRSGSV